MMRMVNFADHVAPIDKKLKELFTVLSGMLFLAVFLPAVIISPVFAENPVSATFKYSGSGRDPSTLTITFDDEWLTRPDNEYNHKLMQASFGLAAAGFRDKEHNIFQKDFNILDFFSQLNFTNPQSEDFDKLTSIDTIATAIASKKIGESTVIAVSVSGNNYENEWLSNLTLDDENRPHGFNTAAGKVFERIRRYIDENKLEGDLRLWISGYSRAAAVSNITAAEATDSGLFSAVYGYTIATPRTTKDEDAAKYDNIFNVINPFDPVPLVPFPEWGFVRYGTDLFLPSQETDSSYSLKKTAADAYCKEAYGHELHYNPLINAQLHTILDFSLFFVSSSDSYRRTIQNGILNFWNTRSLKQLGIDILDRISNLPEITRYQVNEFGEMMDYMMQITYTNLRAQKFRVRSGGWDPSISIKENVMHEHYDESYRSWLFSSDDPADIFTYEPGYIHLSVLGDVDVDIYDMNGSYVFRIDQDGNITTDLPEDSYEIFNAPYNGDTNLFAIRQNLQTLVVIPTDKEYVALIHAHKDEEVRIGYTEYSVKNLRGKVRYVLNEKVGAGEVFFGNINPDVIDTLDADELLAAGFNKLEPWSKEIVYSPAAVMRLENTDIFHPSPIIFVTFSGLILAFFLYIFILSSIGVGKGVKRGVRAIRNRRAGRKENV